MFIKVIETLLDNKSDNLKFLTYFSLDIRAWSTETQQIFLRFYTVAYEPILRHWFLCTPTENILSCPFFMFSGSIERDMWHEVGLRTVKSSLTQMFFRIGVLFLNIQRKTPELESLYNKVAGLQPCSFI